MGSRVWRQTEEEEKEKWQKKQKLKKRIHILNLDYVNELYHKLRRRLLMVQKQVNGLQEKHS